MSTRTRSKSTPTPPAGKTAEANAGRPARIPIPMRVLWQRARYQVAPLLIIALCSIAAIVLWRRQATHVHGIGEVAGLQARIVSPGDGVLVALGGAAPRRFDRVIAGQTIARMARWGDTRPEAAIEVKSPIDGKVLNVNYVPGQRVRTGDVVMTIASERGQYVTTYVRPDEGLRLEPGMAVDVRLRTPGRGRVMARVERMGPQIESIPAHQLRAPRSRDWGIPAILALPPSIDARPGELVDLVFLPSEKSPDFVSPGTPAMDIVVPTAIDRGEVRNESGN